MADHLSDLEAGRLIAAVENLSNDVEQLNARIQNLERELSKGKGLVAGVLLITAGLSGLGGSVFSKWIAQ